MRSVLMMVLMCEGAVLGIAQIPVALDVGGKLNYHVDGAFGPASFAISGVKAAYLQKTDSPTEWGQGSAGYSRRASSSVASSGIRAALAFGLDSALRQDPRYYRSGDARFWSRTGHALRGTILTRTDGGGETLSTWRLGSVYGAAFISNQWYPDRLNTVRRGVVNGTARLGFDVVKNVVAEFWPDIKNWIRPQRH